MTVVYVTRVNIPAMSTIGYGYGTDEDGNPVSFAGDHRPMRDLGEALVAHLEDPEGVEPPVVELEDWQLL